MRMVCHEYGLDYLFKENVAAELLLDSPELFFSFISRLLGQYNGEDFIIFSESDKELHLNKIGEIITNPFQIDLNNRKLLTKIIEDTLKEYQEHCPEKMLQLQSDIERFIINVCDSSDYALTYNDDPVFTELMKLYNVHVDSSNMDIVSKLVYYVKLSHRILNTSLFIFVNLKAYFSNEALELFLQTLSYEKVYIMLIERYDSSLVYNERRIIIDRDACVIYDE